MFGVGEVRVNRFMGVCECVRAFMNVFSVWYFYDHYSDNYDALVAVDFDTNVAIDFV